MSQNKAQKSADMPEDMPDKETLEELFKYKVEILDIIERPGLFILCVWNGITMLDIMKVVPFIIGGESPAWTAQHMGKIHLRARGKDQLWIEFDTTKEAG